MNESPEELLITAAKEDDDKPTSLESFQLNEILNQTDESGHSSHDQCNGYQVLNPGKAKPAQASSRALFVLVIIVCLISLLSLVVTLLMLVGKIGSSNEGGESDNCDGTDVCTAINTLEMKLEVQLKNLYALVENISMSLQPPPASSCKELYDNGLRENKAYMLPTDSGKIPVYCHMTSDVGECGGRGWTLVMKIDGSKQNFHYDSDLWRNKTEFNPPGGETGFDSQETKLPTYWETPFSKICLGMKYGQQIRYIVIHNQAHSLYSLIADDQYRATSLRREKWKSLIGPESSLQRYCITQGFNAMGTNSSYSKARIGIVANNENDCNSCDSRIGFGTGGYPNDSNTCGNEAKHLTDNGDNDITAFGYILVQ